MRSVLFLLTFPLAAQLITNPKAIPHTPNPPVIFLNGFQADCSGADFQGAFGNADKILQTTNRVSLFFNNCTLPGASIEKLGDAFGTFLTSLTYTDGQPVTAVDIIAYSMGGLIFRSYLAGKQESQGVFNPPATVPVRKAILLATPNFGTPVGALALGLNVQADELSSGSHFLMDLNTWNQNRADLRGIEAIAIAGTGGTGVTTTPGFDDGLVPLSSASLDFYMPGRTRILPYCHVSGGGFLTQFRLCPANAIGIASMNAASDQTARIVVSFLDGTADWQSIGTAPENNSFLASGGGMLVRARTAADAAINPSSVRVTPPTGPAKDLNMSNSEIAFTDLVAAGTENLAINAGSSSFNATVTLPAGGTRPFVVKPGPSIGAVVPAPAAVSPLVVAPRMIVSIYGTAMGQSTVTLNGTPLAILYMSDTQINAIVPPDASLGLDKLAIRNAAGTQTINVLVEPAYPVLFAQAAVNATNAMIVSDANPLHAGDYVELFLTGLGVAQMQPTVTIGDVDCPVSYAGPAPGYPGVDQINCIVPSGVAPRSVPLVVTSNGRSSPTAALSVR